MRIELRYQNADGSRGLEQTTAVWLVGMKILSFSRLYAEKPETARELVATYDGACLRPGSRLLEANSAATFNAVELDLPIQLGGLETIEIVQQTDDGIELLASASSLILEGRSGLLGLSSDDGLLLTWKALKQWCLPSGKPIGEQILISSSATIANVRRIFAPVVFEPQPLRRPSSLSNVGY